ncbi:hypothetical protein K474DRAFT_1678412 [Panus rudis PR-1116 ss-1]|nr:hypothetical protein K474DRAFT_1678412 [Panus rudis PR-1116 ss-1]
MTRYVAEGHGPFVHCEDATQGLDMVGHSSFYAQDSVTCGPLAISEYYLLARSVVGTADAIVHFDSVVRANEEELKLAPVSVRRDSRVVSLWDCPMNYFRLKVALPHPTPVTLQLLPARAMVYKAFCNTAKRPSYTILNKPHKSTTYPAHPNTLHHDKTDVLLIGAQAACQYLDFHSTFGVDVLISAVSSGSDVSLSKQELNDLLRQYGGTRYSYKRIHSQDTEGDILQLQSAVLSSNININLMTSTEPLLEERLGQFG